MSLTSLSCMPDQKGICVAGLILQVDAQDSLPRTVAYIWNLSTSRFRSLCLNSAVQPLHNPYASRKRPTGGKKSSVVKEAPSGVQ